MTDKDETIPGAFLALVTGCGMLGTMNYASLPVSSVPELSLAGDKPFTLYTTLCFKNVQSGSILKQKNAFELAIVNGVLYMAAVDWCAVKFHEPKVGTFATDCWYTLALVYDGRSLTVYLDGEKKETFRCKFKKKYVFDTNITIGDNLAAYFKTFRLFDKALSDKEIRLMEAAGGISPEKSIVWFDFDKTGRIDQSPKHIRLSTKGFTLIVRVYPVKQFRFNINRNYPNVEKMVCELFDESKPISFTGCIGSKSNENNCTRLAGMVSFGTPKPVMCKLEGEMFTIWESIYIPQND